MSSDPAAIGIPPDELRAEHVACTHLVRGCEDALARLASEWLEADSLEEEAMNARAAEILNEVLDDWREALQMLRTADAAAQNGPRAAALPPTRR
jgi:predicted glycosyl hydrolase (DUF1957 family)